SRNAHAADVHARVARRGARARGARLRRLLRRRPGRGRRRLRRAVVRPRGGPGGRVCTLRYVEARGLFVRGGLHCLVRQALGEAPARLAASALLTERMLLGPLAAAVAGRYVVAPGAAGVEAVGSGASAENTAVGVAVALLAIGWIA